MLAAETDAQPAAVVEYSQATLKDLSERKVSLFSQSILQVFKIPSNTWY